MTRYRLLEPAVIDGALLPAGAEVDIDWEPGPHMQPLDADGEQHLASFRASRASLEADYPNSGWPIIERLWHGSLVRERAAVPPAREDRTNARGRK